MQLDSLEIIRRRDPEDALGVIANSYTQLNFPAELQQADSGNFQPANIVLSGMGGSCLAGLIANRWLRHDYNLNLPFEVSREYTVPEYVNNKSLVIIFSVSGNTEETLSSLDDALSKRAHIVVITSGGKLLERAQSEQLPYIVLDKISQPRYGVFMHLRSITKVLEHYNILHGAFDELSDSADFVKNYASKLTALIPFDRNAAKQLALSCTGKTVLVFASSWFYPLAYKWKTSFNENAKNIIWCNEFPEFNHNEFIGWTEQPVDKPFCVVSLRSNLDSERVNKRFDLSEQLLSGKRPHSHNVQLTGDTYIKQAICGAILGDFTSIYLAISNNIDPTPVPLVEKFKHLLVQ